jgi:hypothetical protein
MEIKAQVSGHLETSPSYADQCDRNALHVYSRQCDFYLQSSDQSDNSLPWDGDPLGVTDEDPFHEGPPGYYHLARNQTYEEINGFTNSESTILAGEDSLRVNGALPGAYCFRVIEGNGTPLDSYAFYSQIEIQAPNP